jgi:hypothetical protein
MQRWFPIGELALAAGAVFVVACLAKMGSITIFISKAVFSGFIVDVPGSGRTQEQGNKRSSRIGV